jgi:NTE family protein
MKRHFLLAAGCCALAVLAGCQSVNPETGARAGGSEVRAAGAAAPPGVAAPASLAVPPAPPGAPRPLRIALALGGGAARGFAHVGVIKALEARGIEPDIVVGTSVGSFVAAIYAAGYAGADLQQVAMQFEESAVTDWSLPSRGVFKGIALQDFVNSKVDERPIEKLPRKLAIVATDLGSGEIMVFERGNVGMAVRASSSVPGVFQPVSIGGHEYVDGGLVSPIPVRTARRLGADVVIAVDISKRPADQSTTGAFDILLQTFAIMGQVIGRSELQSADIVLRPSPGSVGSTDFTARESAIQEGEQAVAAQAVAIAAIVDHARQNLAGMGAAATP